MAYLHCHNCSWSQDDFYTRGYNPITKIKSTFKSWGKPRYVKFDSWWIKETGIMAKSDNSVFSWWVLWYDLKRKVRSMFRMKWWTWKSFHKDKELGMAKCPKCNSDKDFDID